MVLYLLKTLMDILVAFARSIDWYLNSELTLRQFESDESIILTFKSLWTNVLMPVMYLYVL